MVGFVSEYVEWGEIVILVGCDFVCISNVEGEIGVVLRFFIKFEWNVVSCLVVVDWMWI